MPFMHRVETMPPPPNPEEPPLAPHDPVDPGPQDDRPVDPEER
jgi:hypothetical protein